MDDEIGVALKRARLDKKMSLRQVAEQLNISTSLLSQVENGKTQPSVKTLFGLATVLEVSLDEIVTGRSLGIQLPQDRDAAAGIQRSADNPVLEMENGVTWQRLATGGRTDIEPLYVTYQAGASSSVDGKLMRHAGAEFAYILEGVLRLKLDFDEHELGPGDSFCFDSSRPHLFYNPGTIATRGVWFVFDNAPAAPDVNSLLDALRPTNGTGKSRTHLPLFGQPAS
ncbi:MULTISPECIES: XRE family transcriptional regulator [unclassified Rhodococcus (in: high G+C Gram-positive bacteria)]|uniref:helix-turn-helix domain-containing protein n=1 Tax=unclassified Rhodococcus (in: high G+C Gram-positive bacteria) TaxID=192944 RepID=UPI0028990F03|nr:MULTISPECIES: XRE family transcriptional regulator [unclassified Rhodococcus (in: high G+C Gram-positive bacteria)]